MEKTQLLSLILSYIISKQNVTLSTSLEPGNEGFALTLGSSGGRETRGVRLGAHIS